MMMGHAPPEYGQAMDALGYVKAKDLVTYELPVVGEVPSIVEKTQPTSWNGYGASSLHEPVSG
jgi:hypothetical protein